MRKKYNKKKENKKLSCFDKNFDNVYIYLLIDLLFVISFVR